jgi:hypothetical protein
MEIRAGVSRRGLWQNYPLLADCLVLDCAVLDETKTMSLAAEIAKEFSNVVCADCGDYSHRIGTDGDCGECSVCGGKMRLETSEELNPCL